MKIYLHNTIQHQKHLSSLKLALQFYSITGEIVCNYDLNFENENIKITKVSDIFEHLKTETEDVFFGTSATVFTAEALSECNNAFKYYNNAFSDCLIKLTFENDYLKYTSPTLLYHGNNRLWCTTEKIYADYPTVYGNAQVIYKFITKQNQRLFNDGIFRGGPTTIFSPLPPLAFDTSKELPIQIMSAAFDASSYIESIPILD